MRGRDWLTANLNVIVVRSRMNVSCRRFSDFWKLTANVANAMLLMKNCAVQHVQQRLSFTAQWSIALDHSLIAVAISDLYAKGKHQTNKINSDSTTRDWWLGWRTWLQMDVDYHPRMRRGNAFGRVCVCLFVCVFVSQFCSGSVCLCVCLPVCSGSNFWKLWPTNFTFRRQVHLQNIHINFVYQGHWAKVKVTAAKKRVNVSRSRVVCLWLKDNLVSIKIFAFVTKTDTVRGRGSRLVLPVELPLTEMPSRYSTRNSVMIGTQAFDDWLVQYSDSLLINRSLCQ